MVKFIAYLRVSTKRQGKSGLGLTAQHRKISDFVAGAGTLTAKFCDVQPGKDDTRVELQRAIQLAKRESARIIIARLDRFSQRVSFIANILEQGMGLMVLKCPMP